MRLLLVLAVCLLAGGTLSAGMAEPLNLYVSRQGRDTWSGRRAAAGHRDGPFATLERALAEIRARRSAGTLPPQGVVVWIRGGSYPRRAALTLTAADTPVPVVFRAYRAESVRLIGGRQVDDWKPVTDPDVLQRLDAHARGHVWQADLRAQGIRDYGRMARRGFGAPVVPAGLELFFEDRPMTLARWPNTGQWATIAGTPAGQDGGRFTYTGDRPRRWKRADDIWLHGYWTYDWADTYEKVASIDLERHEIRTVPPHGAFGYTPGHRFYALNLLEELDQPGEWYLDRKRGLLYFWPPAPLAGRHAVVSLIPALVSLDGASHVTLRGLTLEDCRGTAVTIRGGTGNRVAGCLLRNVGNRAVEIQGGTDNGVLSCDIAQAGDGGVLLAGGDRLTLTPGRSFVVNCHIHHYSRWSRTYRPAVQIDGVGNRVAHNLIHDGPHNAIQLGGNDNVIEFNEVHHVCQETGDVGAFYMGRDWTMRGNVVRDNYFHDLGGGRGLRGFSDAMAIYLDDAASGTLVSGNLCVRAGHAVLVGGGRDNTVTNNIFIDCKPAVSVDARGLGWAAKMVAPGGEWQMQAKLEAVRYDRPPYSTRYPKLATILQNDPAAPEGNVVSRNIAYHCPNWLDVEEKARAGVLVEKNLADADPQFVDVARGDYHLKATSPALSLGFRPLPLAKIGLYHDEYRARLGTPHPQTRSETHSSR